jgi:hypothetical protein
MRCVPLILMTAAIAGCSTAPVSSQRSARGAEHLQRLLAGKSAGAPTACLSGFRSNDMVTIDEDTIAFRRNGNQVYVNNVSAGCSQMAAPGSTLVFRNVGGTGLCRGDIAEVTYLSSGTTVGSCVLGDFVPYSRS